MKARKLRAILNDTRYAISNNRDYIAVGSPLCHDLISVNKETMKVKYALDTFREGRKALDRTNEELLFIWDKLHELIETGEINDIINGKDEIENPLPVFTVKGGELIESVTDFYGWPNTDDDGICMHNNTHFPTRRQAIEYGISKLEIGVKWAKEHISQKEVELKDRKEELLSQETSLAKLKAMQ